MLPWLHCRSFRAYKIPAHAYYIINIRSTYKDDANASVTEKLVREVKGNNSFLEADIQGKSKLEFILL